MTVDTIEITTSAHLLELEPAEFQMAVDALIAAAFEAGDPAAEDLLQRLLYRINAFGMLPPWDQPDPRVYGVHIEGARLEIDAAWARKVDEQYRQPLRDELAGRNFTEWAVATCRHHPSGPSHALFTFLADRADHDQLRAFLHQETPFDIHFADLLSMLLAGVHGGAKMELAHNFWDEMGTGSLARTHRQLRLDTMQAVGIARDAHLVDVEEFWIEEIRLANMYFQCCRDRNLAPQATGMLLATELVVPGRIERQIDGWKRVGVPPRDLAYLTEHVTVDIEHADGWINEVVVPLLSGQPELALPLAIGVRRRLDASIEVCDRAVRELTV
jgi:pyrroloquinoline quinone (PQQ) biosynthesis protein C